MDDRIGATFEDRDPRMKGRRIIVLEWDDRRGKYRCQSAYWHERGGKRGYTYISGAGLSTRWKKVIDA